LCTVGAGASYGGDGGFGCGAYDIGAGGSDFTVGAIVGA
jgi:hypothetical protein